MSLPTAGLRRITAVDADIDIADPAAIEWAVATRMRPERDVVIVSGAKRGPDPMARERASGRLGLIAMIPPGREDDHVRAVVEWDGPVTLPRRARVPERPAQPVTR